MFYRFKKKHYFCKKFGTDIALYELEIKHMKQKKHTIPFDYSALISPITPRVRPLDGIGSLFNLTGTYYDIHSNLEALCKASEHISGLNEVWKNVGMDIFKATNQFAEFHNLIGKISTFEHQTPKLPNNSWEHLLNPKKY